MIQHANAAAEEEGRLLYLQLLAESRRTVAAWMETPHPAELEITPPLRPAVPPVPTTAEIPTLSRPSPGRHRVTRLRPLGMSAAILTGAGFVLQNVDTALSAVT